MNLVVKEPEEGIKEMLERRVLKDTPLSVLSRRYNLPVSEIMRMLDEYSGYVAFLRKEKEFIGKGQYRNLEKMSNRVLKEILNTPHKINDVTDLNILKLKKSVAEGVLETTGAKTSKNPSIMVNTQVNNKTEEKQQPRKNAMEILEACLVNGEYKT